MIRLSPTIPSDLPTNPNINSVRLAIPRQATSPINQTIPSPILHPIKPQPYFIHLSSTNTTFLPNSTHNFHTLTMMPFLPYPELATRIRSLETRYTSLLLRISRLEERIDNDAKNTDPLDRNTSNDSTDLPARAPQVEGSNSSITEDIHGTKENEHTIPSIKVTPPEESHSNVESASSNGALHRNERMCMNCGNPGHAKESCRWPCRACGGEEKHMGLECGER